MCASNLLNGFKASLNTGRITDYSVLRKKHESGTTLKKQDLPGVEY